MLFVHISMKEQINDHLHLHILNKRKNYLKNYFGSLYRCADILNEIKYYFGSSYRGSIVIGEILSFDFLA